MLIESYIIVSENGNVTAKKRKPAGLQGGQIAFKLAVEVPEDAFDPDYPTAQVELSSEDVAVPALEVRLAHTIKKL